MFSRFFRACFQGNKAFIVHIVFFSCQVKDWVNLSYFVLKRKLKMHFWGDFVYGNCSCFSKEFKR